MAGNLVLIREIANEIIVNDGSLKNFHESIRVIVDAWLDRRGFLDFPMNIDAPK